MIARLARIDIASITLFEMASTHFYLRLLRWMRISLPYGHVDLLIIFLITCNSKFIMGETTPRRRFHVTILHVATIETTFRS